jgi:MFS family permease
MSYAAVFSFRQDLRLTPAQYSWLGSAYFLGYLVFEFPGAYLLQRLPLSRTMGCTILAWGALLLCMAAPRSFAGMAALRTLLGASESLVTPGFVLLVSRFYARAEQPLRVGLWYSCNGLGSFAGALVSYAMGHVRVPGVPEWAWIFILNGAVTLLFGVLFLCVCPDSPDTWGRLSPRERAAALERVRGNRASLHSRTWKWGQCAEALLPWRDPLPWAYALIVLTVTIPNGGIANFLHLIVSPTSSAADRRSSHQLQSYGYDAFQTILWGLPQAAMQVVFPLSGAYLACALPNARCYVMAAYVSCTAVGLADPRCCRASRAW